MTAHVLDRPAHAALTSRHAAVGQRHGGAMRYDPGVVPFVADNATDPGDLAALVAPGEIAAFLQRAPADLPGGFEEVFRGDGVQMLLTGPVTAPDDPRIAPLGPEDAAEMLALAEATKPGPFTARAQEIGRFWGIRQDGVLVAMAGERMAADGYVELSGVCVAEAARGQGLARLLSRHVASTIAAQGDVPFLHAFAANRAAISLYASLGFELRTPVAFAIFRRGG